MMRALLVPLLVAVALAPALAQDLAPKAGPQEGPIAIVNAEVHPVSGPVIPRGYVVFADGAAHDTYQAAPAHGDFIEENQGNWAAAARELQVERANLHHLAKRLGLK